MLSQQKNKILLIVQLPPPVHGASVMNNYLVSSEKLKNKFNLEIINLQFIRKIEEITRFSLRKIYKSIYYSFEIIRKISVHKPDLVYFTLSLSGYALYRDAFYVFLIKLLRKKIVFHLHGKGIKSEMKKNAVKKYLYQLVFRNTYVICLSQSLTKDIEDVNKSIPFVVPNGIQQRKPIVEKKSSDEGYIPQILYLSNYMRDKGITVLIDALKILKDQGYVFNSRLVGAPIDLKTEFLHKLINDNNLSDCVQITGPLYDKEKTDELNNADLFVFPTRYPNEAFPLVILEAMQFGLPVISTYEGGIPEMVVDNRTGFLVESQNPQMLAEKIAILLNDKDMRTEMGKQGLQRFIANYTLERFETDMINTFNSILS
jgi:glycosyltransferase involved in cell wall biosynthesis